MTHAIIGTAGHVDHGKTRLIRALTGIDTDRLAEEKRRGLTIELGFAYLELPNGERAGIVDVPGHEKFIRSMLAGAGGIDAALLVIAADEGVMPQTREHMDILSLLGITRGCVALTKVDMVDEEWLSLVTNDVREALRGTPWEAAPIIPVSAYTGFGIETLREALFALVRETRGKAESAPFRLPVDRAFSVQGFGMVVTGTLIEGTLAPGQDVMIYPGGIPAKARGVQVHSTPVERAYAGQRVAVNLPKLKKEDVPFGAALAEPGSMQPSLMLDVALEIVPGTARTVKSGSRLHFYHGTAETLCKAVLLGGVEELSHGDEGYAQLRFETPVCAKAGDRFVVRFYSPEETVGGGMVLDPRPEKHRHADEGAAGLLASLHYGSAEERLDALLREHSPRFAAIDKLRLQAPLSRPEFDAALGALAARGRAVPVADGIYLHADFIGALGERLHRYLSQYHAQNPLRRGARREEIASGLIPYVEQPLAFGVLARLAARGKVRQKDGFFSLPEFSVALSQKQAALCGAVLEKCCTSGLVPLERAALAAEFGRNADFSDVLGYLVDEGELVPLEGELLLAKEGIERAKAMFFKLADAGGEVTLAQFRDAANVSRKVALLILEYLDKCSVTEKRGDARVRV